MVKHNTVKWSSSQLSHRHTRVESGVINKNKNDLKQLNNCALPYTTLSMFVSQSIVLLLTLGLDGWLAGVRVANEQLPDEHQVNTVCRVLVGSRKLFVKVYYHSYFVDAARTKGKHPPLELCRGGAICTNSRFSIGWMVRGTSKSGLGLPPCRSQCRQINMRTQIILLRITLWNSNVKSADRNRIWSGC